MAKKLDKKQEELLKKLDELLNLPPNEPKEDFSPTVYYDFMISMLENNEGIITQAELEAAVIDFFSDRWSKEDRRLVKSPLGGKRTKWQNSLHWAKQHGTRYKKVFNRGRQENGVKVKYIVLPGVCKNQELVDWCMRKKGKNNFTKWCPRPSCRGKNLLSDKVCRHCNKAFPPTSIKVKR